MKLFYKLSDDLELIPDNQDTLNWMAGRKSGEIIEFEAKTEKQRTPTQNRCLHDYMGELANKLNEAGIDVKEVILLPMSFTKEIIKENMVKRIVKAMFPNKIKINKNGMEAVSTTDLSTKEITVVYDHLDKFTAEEFGIHVPWPSRFNH